MPSRYRSIAPVLLASASVLVSASGLHAQGDRGAISGRVTDPSGATAKGATVTLTNEDTKVGLETRTNDSGEYSFPTLNSGRYTVAVSTPGFEDFVREHIQVDVGGRVSIDAALTVGSAKAEVSVQSEVQQLSYTSASLGMTIEQKSITDLPLIYGNPFALEFLTPGVTLSGVNPNLHVYDSGTATVSVNGSSLNSLDYKL
ncbi:MAG: carboxypeptidase-like regulatory domain-containing protein, partial [Janthinobacterium lividum]